MSTEEERRAEVKPCPFCGYEARVRQHHDYWRVECRNDGCQTLGPVVISFAADAIEAWNLRPSPDTDAPTFGLHWEIPRAELATMTGEDVDEGLRNMRRLLNRERDQERRAARRLENDRHDS